MTEQNDSFVTPKAMYEAINGLRGEVQTSVESLREDNRLLREESRLDRKELKEEVVGALNSTLDEFRKYTEAHGKSHDALEREGTKALQTHLHEEELHNAGKTILVNAAKWAIKNRTVIAAVLAVVASWVFLDSDLPVHIGMLIQNILGV